VNYNFGELQKPTCNLQNLAITVGNLFFHFERSYQSNPALMTKLYPILAPYLAAGKVPKGIGPFPKGALAYYWVPTLGTKPIKIFTVKGLPPLSLGTQTPAKGTVTKPTLKPKAVSQPKIVRTAMLKPAHVTKTIHK
jgi:hypothetical protein